jgi:hypothetical protein
VDPSATPVKRRNIMYDLKRPEKSAVARISINREASLEELTTQYLREFFHSHGATPRWTPNPLTKEWLVDQLEALDWYLPYDFAIGKAPEQNTIKKSKRKPKEENPFK